MLIPRNDVSPHPLTRRERRLYTAINRVAHVIFWCFVLSFFLLPCWMCEMSEIEVVLWSCAGGANGVLGFAFGAALRLDLRIIRGVPWLREGPADPQMPKDRWDFSGR
jgi:hypothetical protein